MENILKLSDSQKLALKNVLKQELENLNERKREIEDLLLQINGPQVSLKDEQQPKSVLSDLSWAEKAKYVLKNEGYALTTSEIFDKIKSIDSAITNENKATLTGVISARISKGKLFKRNNKVVGLLEWFDGDRLKDEFQREF